MSEPLKPHKALSVHQPWIEAICLPEPTEPGAPRPKRIDNRDTWQERHPAITVARKLVGSRILLHASLSVGKREEFGMACEVIVSIMGPANIVPRLVTPNRARVAWPPASSLPRGALVAWATLADVVTTTPDGHRTEVNPHGRSACRLCGARTNAPCAKPDPWASPGIGLVFADVARLPAPIPFTGRQGWFNVSVDVVAPC